MVYSLFITILICFFIGLLVARFDLKKNPNISVDNAHLDSRIIHIIVSLMVGIFLINLIAQFYDRLMQEFPLLIQRYSIYLLWLTISALLGFMSGYLIYIAKKVETKLKFYSTISSLFIAVLAVLILNILTIKPVVHLLKQKIVDGVILQSSGYSCMAASIANVAKIYDKNITEKEVASIAGTTILGTSHGQMRYTLNQLHIKFKPLNNNFESLLGVAPPAILFVYHPAVGREGHAVVYTGKKEDKYEIIDPLEGRVLWSKEMLNKKWDGNGAICYE